MHSEIPEQVIDAIQLLETCPRTRREAARMLRSPQLTMDAVERRLPRMVASATRDETMSWTEEEEHTLLRAAQFTVHRDPRRDDMLRIRVSAEERATIEARARAANRAMSDYVRLRSLGEL